MLSNELNYLVSLEQHQDRLRGLERHQLVQLVGRTLPSDRKIHRRVVAWVGGQLVRWGLALQGYGPQPQQPYQAGVSSRVR